MYPIYFTLQASIPPTEIHTISQTILNDCMEQSPTFHTCISSFSSPQMIAFAGYLLEYPASYYPVASSPDAFLCDTPLEVYECILIPSVFVQQRFVLWNHSCYYSIMRYLFLSRHSFMKFSRPGGDRDSSGTLVDMIQRRFKKRLGQLHTEWVDVKVICDTITLDRVAL